MSQRMQALQQLIPDLFLRKAQAQQLSPAEAASRMSGIPQMTPAPEAPSASAPMPDLKWPVMPGINDQPELPPVPMRTPEPAALETSAPKAAPRSKPSVAPEAVDKSQVVRDYIAKKYGFGEGLDRDAIKDAQGQADQKLLLANLAQAGNTVGAAIAGTKADNSFYDNLRSQSRQGVDDLMTQRRAEAEDIQFGNMQRDASMQAQEDDPASELTSTYQRLASRMMPGRDFSKMSATDIKRILPSVERLYEMDQRALDRREARDERRALLGFTRAEKAREGLRKRETPYGIARTEDDAKKLKDASELKSKLDSQVNELIQLREKYGAETLNRNAVARAQQLSKDLLLTKKNLESLGVLSQSDKDIVNEIIPDDPLQFDMSQMIGQDPTMTKLKSFKSDTDKDFTERLRNRLDPQSFTDYESSSSSFPKQIRKGNQTATVSTPEELAEAQAEGWQ